MERYHVLGIPVDAVDMDETMDAVDGRIRQAGKPGYILAVNPEKVYALRKNPFLRGFFEQAFLLIPDGIGVVMATRFLFGTPIRRVPGADLMQRLCSVAVEKGYRIFIYGAKEEVNRRAVEILRDRHPGIQIVGRANGYVKEEDMGKLVAQINEARPDVLFVALGSPRQEEWMSRHLASLNVKACQGIGGTLDTIVGTVKRAPLFWQRLGLEWFYRLLCDPRRLRRQSVLPIFVLEVLKQGIGRVFQLPGQQLP
jgi:N-acetylglucosaminyldiphosphoundecaprenol N-acetyl-beta-D-mannosaminyltransferase